MERDKFQNEVYTWANKTFPESNIDSRFEHLQEEIQELKELIEIKQQYRLKGGAYDISFLNKIGNELADCNLFLMQIASDFGISYNGYTREKFEENKKSKFKFNKKLGYYKRIKF